MTLNFIKELLEGKLYFLSLSFMSSESNRMYMLRLRICESETMNCFVKFIYLLGKQDGTVWQM